MTVQYLAIEDVAGRCHTTVTFIREMAQCELIELQAGAGGEVLSNEDAERVRVGVLLIEELEVNLAGVEVILHMRDSIVSMQRQFAELLARLASDAKARGG